MNIRLACIGCDTTEADGVKKIPPGWTHVDKLTPRDLKQQELGEWETHQGFCPVCSENAELLVMPELWKEGGWWWVLLDGKTYRFESCNEAFDFLAEEA